MCVYMHKEKSLLVFSFGKNYVGKMSRHSEDSSNKKMVHINLLLVVMRNYKS